jgi:hypothetical protein
LDKKLAESSLPQLGIMNLPNASGRITLWSLTNLYQNYQNKKNTISGKKNVVGA